MRREPTSRWLTEYNFYTHSFLSFLSGVGRGGGALESCAVIDVPERQSLFDLLESFANSFYNCIAFSFCKFKSSLEIFENYTPFSSILILLDFIFLFYYSFFFLFFLFVFYFVFWVMVRASKPRKSGRDNSSYGKMLIMGVGQSPCMMSSSCGRTLTMQ